MNKFSSYQLIRYFLVCLLLLVIVTSSRSQIPSLRFTHLMIQDGLQNENVRYIYQDHEGFMWFGTASGVDRYDGKSFENFTDLLLKKSGNQVVTITGIVEDSFHNLWFLNDTNGIILFNKYTERVKVYKYNQADSRSLSSNHIRAIYEDRHKNIWLGTLEGGLNMFNRKDSTFIRFRHDSADAGSIGSDRIIGITEDLSGDIWLTSADGLLIRFDQDTKKFENIRISNTSWFIWYGMNNPVIYADDQSNIWFTDNAYLYCYFTKEKRIQKFDFNLNKEGTQLFADITGFMEIEKGIFLISTYRTGLYMLNITTGEIRHHLSSPMYPSGINSNNLSGIYRSREGVIWIGTYDNGINIYSNRAGRFPLLSNMVDKLSLDISSPSTFALCGIPDGRIFIGCENNGVLLYDPVKKSITRVLTELKNFSVFDIDYFHDELWISCWLNGLYRYNVKTNKLVRLNEPASLLPYYNTCVRTLLDRNNRIWFGSISEGLAMRDLNTGEITTFRSKKNDVAGLSNNTIYKLFEDSDGDIWIGTNKGLNKYVASDRTLKRVTLKDKSGSEIFNIVIYDILEDQDKKLWIATNRSLYSFDKKSDSIKIFQNKNSDKVNVVTALMQDDQQRIWLGTGSGISSFNRKTNAFKNYGVSDGLQQLAFNPTAALKTKDNTFYLGSRKGIVVFNPAKLLVDTFAPPVFLTSVSVNDQPVNLQSNNPLITTPIQYAKKIKLKYKQSTIKFSFAALNYNNPDANLYAYMLEGFDNDWIMAGSSNTAHYANLRPGRYIFHVIASNSHGYWNKTGTEIIIHIRQPFWRNKIFLYALAFAIFVMVVIFYNKRLKVLEKTKSNLEGDVRARTSALNNAKVVLSEQHEEILQRNEEITSQNELLSKMSSEILKQNAELENHRSNLEKLVIERTRELEIAVHKAEESDRLKSAFLANMSHEIRTPMNAIVGFANLLKDEDLNPSERNDFIEIINTNSETLLILIDDILDLSLIEANQITVRNEVFNLNELLDHIYSSYSLMNRKGKLVIRLNNQLHDLDIKINSDRTRIRQILSNLMNNAYKFSDEGFIELGCIKKDNHIIFYVKDTGIGITSSDIDRIFERFRKSEEKTNTVYRGAGLGLAISRGLAEKLGGKLSVISQWGTGSTFFLEFPWSLVSDSEIATDAITVPQTNSTGEGLNILIVEDEQANYLYAKKLLSRLNVNIHWAENGMDAIRLTQSGTFFRIILMDIKMPVMNGFEATKAIKASNPAQVIIALTAYARSEDRNHFMQAGFDDYLAKPIKPNDFIAVIKRYL